VTWDVGAPGGHQGLPSDIALAGAGRFDFVAVSRSLQPELASTVEWLRVRAPTAPFRLRWLGFYLAGAPQVARARADVVHTFAPAPLVPNRVDLATVNFCHAGFHEAGGSAGRLTSRMTLALERWSYSGSRTRLIEIETEAAAEAFGRHYPGAQVEVVRRRLDVDRYRPDPDARSAIRRELGASGDTVVAVFAGRDHHAKGLRFAIEGAAIAQRTVDAPLALWVTGYDDSGYVGRMAARAGIESQVQALGWRSDMDRLYAGADMLVLPSVYEQGSRASHEAAATGLPLVATPVHGATALIGDDEGGIRVRRDAESVAEAVARLASDPDLRSRMGRAARERLLELNAGADHTARFLDLYDRLAA